MIRIIRNTQKVELIGYMTAMYVHCFEFKIKVMKSNGLYYIVKLLQLSDCLHLLVCINLLIFFHRHNHILAIYHPCFYINLTTKKK